MIFDPTSHVTCNKREQKMRNCTFQKKLKKCFIKSCLSPREKMRVCSFHLERKRDRDLSSKQVKEIEREMFETRRRSANEGDGDCCTRTGGFLFHRFWVEERIRRVKERSFIESLVSSSSFSLSLSCSWKSC